MHLMVVDDHAELLDLVERALSRDGHVLRSARSLAEARDALAEHAPDVLVLDLALPDGTGIDFCKELRSTGAQFPILLLTAHGEVPQRVAGLDAGADDFLAKPFAMAELRARVRALSRRGNVERSLVLSWGALTLDFGARRATRASQEIPLTAREWALIELFASRLGRVVARADILDSVWGEQNEQASASLDVLIGRLRRKLTLDALRTVRGAGYMLERA
ncbi:MAG TPA: response regulator transcription factor [Polyangiales bacterium]|nr:response regulator transcription factor [Polyangiales bacterium]